MRISTAEIKILVLELVEDGKMHTVSDFKEYISQRSNKEWTSGQVAGALYQLAEAGKLNNIERGLYKKGETVEGQTNGSIQYNRANQGESQFRNQIGKCLRETEKRLEEIANQINIMKLDATDFEFLREVKLLNEQIKRIADKC